MSAFKLKELSFGRFRSWLKRANESKSDDPIDAFISAWISFNHYYSTFFASENRNAFQGQPGDKVQWLFLIRSGQFKEFFADYRTRYPECFEVSIRLPVTNMLNGNPVPEGLQGEYKLKDLTDEQIFLTIYQIRNNLFHGEKDPTKNKRDMYLCTVAGGFLIPFLARLLTSTYGEVIDAYGPDAETLRKYVRELAAA